MHSENFKADFLKMASATHATFKNTSHPQYLVQRHDSRIKITSRTCSFETCKYLRLVWNFLVKDTSPFFSFSFWAETWFKNQNNEQNLQFWDMQISQIANFSVKDTSRPHFSSFFFFFFEQKHDSRIKIRSRTCSVETCRYFKLPNFKLRLAACSCLRRWIPYNLCFPSCVQWLRLWHHRRSQGSKQVWNFCYKYPVYSKAKRITDRPINQNNHVIQKIYLIPSAQVN